MDKIQALRRMVAPGTRRKGKYREGVIQIWVTRSCDKSCFGCTQGSNLKGNTPAITIANFEKAVISLKDYFGVVGMFGGNPTLHPQFETLCEILREHIPYEQRGIWCNNLFGKGKVVRDTFNPSVSNINVHLDQEAAAEFKRDWPEVHVVGLQTDSRHSPPFVAMQDVIEDEGKRWELISNCDINKHWSAMIGQFRGEARAWFCEIAGAQSILHQNDPDYPDTGVEAAPGWWRLGMAAFEAQVVKHCHECSVPLRIYGELSQATEGVEKTSLTHLDIYTPKKSERIVESLDELDSATVSSFIDYIGNAKR